MFDGGDKFDDILMFEVVYFNVSFDFVYLFILKLIQFVFICGVVINWFDDFDGNIGLFVIILCECEYQYLIYVRDLF